MDLASIGSTLVSGLLGGGTVATIGVVIFTRWLRQYDESRAQNAAALERRLALVEAHGHPVLEARLNAAEAGIDPARAGAIDQQLRTISGQLNHVEGRVETIVERQATIAQQVTNNADYIRSVSAKGDRTAERLERRIENLEVRK